ncbi:hypothetical protein CR513_51007, partial [Mucuna pruriens]
MTPIWNYLHNGTSSEDEAEAAKVHGTANQYVTKWIKAEPLAQITILTYETDAMISVKIGKPSQRRSSLDPSKNPSAMRVDHDLVEEAREQECIRQATCRQWVSHRYNSKV